MTYLECVNLINYDPETGTFSTPSGDVLKGYRHSAGYVKFAFRGKCFYAHRLAWIFINREELQKHQQIDHINRIKSDNRYNNLRLVNNAENKQNQSAHKDSKSGVKGVSWSKHNGTWVLNITVNGKRVVSRNFHTLEDAKIASESFYADVHLFSPENGSK